MRALSKLLECAINILRRHWRRRFEAETKDIALARQVAARQIRDALRGRLQRTDGLELRKNDGFKRDE